MWLFSRKKKEFRQDSGVLKSGAELTVTGRNQSEHAKSVVACVRERPGEFDQVKMLVGVADFG